ncbi:ABC transporter permease [Elioraea sp.]|uniref:ABC transporter permease n=1 Tax=Elioraea sp. TaxID=2185103 RepID=UPI0025BA4855|nr:ABC transporter permease [Elioraea sp.]
MTTIAATAVGSASPARGTRRRAGRYALRAIATLVFCFMFLPVFFVAWISLFDQQIVSFPPDGYTFAWYANALSRPEFARGFVTSLQVATVATLVGVSLGAAASYAMVRYRFPGRGALNTLLLGPLVVPGIVAGTALYVYYVALENAFDLDIRATLGGLVLGHVLLTIPWTVRLVSASLIGLDRAMEEAAANLGAPPLVVFRRVTLPMMRPGLVAASLFSFIQSFENLELSLLLVGPGRITLPVAMLNYLEFRIDPTIAAVATMQIILIGALMLITDRFVKLSRIV